MDFNNISFAFSIFRRIFAFKITRTSKSNHNNEEDNTDRR